MGPSQGSVSAGNEVSKDQTLGVSTLYMQTVAAGITCCIPIIAPLCDHCTIILFLH
jgi:hypothetical protein